MKYLNLFEKFEFNEEDFDFEEEPIVEIIGNQHFTDFLVERDIYYKFIESIHRCFHDGHNTWSIKEINNRAWRIGLYDVIDDLINWSCAYDDNGVDWSDINSEWKRKCIDDESYTYFPKNENFDFNDDDFDFEEEEPNRINLPEDFQKGDRVIIGENLRDFIKKYR